MSRKIPSFEECMKLMHKHNPQLQEDGFAMLRPHADKYVDELKQEFAQEQDLGLRCWILALLGEAKSPKAFLLFVDALRGEEESFWYWAIIGLQELDTKEARTELYEAQSYTKMTEEKTDYFRGLFNRNY